MENLLTGKLRAYKRKLYLSRLIKGLIIALILIFGLISFTGVLEFSFNFDTTVRKVLFFGLLLLFTGAIAYWIVIPLLYLSGVLPPISDENASREIGKYFPEIDDKLLNTIQLSKDNGESDLIIASINRRMDDMKLVPFAKAVDFSINWKYARILGILIVIVVLTSLAFPSAIVDSSKRIVNYNKEYIPEAPFTFSLENESLNAFRNEDFQLRVKMEGNSLPETVFLHVNDRDVKMTPLSADQFEFTFNKPYQNINFYLNAAGFRSEEYQLNILTRPEIGSFNIELDYPAHTRKVNESVSNVGNLQIPEGTKATWQINAKEANSVWLAVSDPSDSLIAEEVNNVFSVSGRFMKSTGYEIKSVNQYSLNKEKLAYNIDIIKDELPSISNQFFADTVLYEYVVVAGSIADDYGIRSLELVAKRDKETKKVRIPATINSLQQTYYFRWDLDSLNLEDDEQLEVYVEVTDNDAINGFKKVKSPSYLFKVPGKAEIRNELAKKSGKAEQQLQSSIQKSKNLNEKLEELQNRLRSKKEIEWQEERMLEEILKQRQALEEEIQKLKEDFNDLKDGEQKFNERSEQLQDKADQIQELMDELLDEETKKLYDELQKLLEEQAESNEIQEMMNRMSPNEQDLENELERTLELFKRLKMESELERTGKDLEELAEKQQQLAEETANKEKSTEESAQEQEKIAEEFEKIKEQLDNVQELNQDLKDPEPMQDFSGDEQEIDESMKDAQEQLENNKRKDGSQSQQQSGQQMQQMSQKMEEMQAAMQSQTSMENIDNLRDIVDNLVKLSFKEEELIKEFRNIRQVDPRFVELSQEQLKLKDDAQVIQDSLLALAGRVAELSSFVTREVTEMNRNIDGALSELRDRNRGRALSNQQYAMSSMNNLSLLLSDALQQMQQAMANASPSNGNDKNKKDGKKKGMGDLKKLQQQLSQQIKELKESGQKGRKLSESLAKMAAQQEMIRNQLREFQKQLEGQPGNEEIGKQLGEIMEQMEMNEIDLVNKRLTEQLINRQKDIETRMLEAENSTRDQDFDNKREAQSAAEYNRQRPKVFEEYLKAREKEIELLKNVPLELSPFYKKEVNEYFRRLSRDN